MAYETDFLSHVKVMHDLLPRFQVGAKVDLSNFRLTLRGRNREYELIPQFMNVSADGGILYTPEARDTTQGFIGWLPYSMKKWPLAATKIAFKQFCNESGLCTPRYWTRPEDEPVDFIVKKAGGSFSKGIRGPFHRFDAEAPGHRLATGEYYEQFRRGTIAKAWYWDDKIVSLDLRQMPTITGDGKRSFYELVGARLRNTRTRIMPERDDVAQIARYQGLSLDEIVPAGHTVLADFRYVSLLHLKSAFNTNALPKIGEPLRKQLDQAGATLWKAIPEDIRANTLWSLDAIVEDDGGLASFLEMNCNPIMHPDAYFRMLEGLFGAPEPERARPPEGPQFVRAGITTPGAPGFNPAAGLAPVGVPAPGTVPAAPPGMRPPGPPATH